MKKHLMLDNEERELLESIESGEWVSVSNLEEELRRNREYARNALKKDRRVSIRISSRDLEEIQTRAVEEGIPYQTLIASVLHKYISGLLIDGRSEIRTGSRPPDVGGRSQRYRTASIE